MGTKGEIRADSGRDRIEVNAFTGESKTYEKVSSESDGFGHGGGDVGIIRDFLTLMEGGDEPLYLTDINETIESHVIALAAEESRSRGGALVNTARFVKRQTKK